MFLHQSHKNIIVIIIKPSSWNEGKKASQAERFGKQATSHIQYTFIVFRYVFIVQQFADVPAVHF